MNRQVFEVLGITFEEYKDYCKENKNIIKIGPIIFNKNDFKYAIIQEK